MTSREMIPNDYEENFDIKKELEALRYVAKEQKKTLFACKQFFEQLQEKGLTLSFTERTATSLLIEQIKRFA